MRLKNADYGGTREGLANYEYAARVLDQPASHAVLIRLAEKVYRLGAVAKNKAVAVTDESIEDTLLDIINLAVLYSAASTPSKTA